MREIPPGYRLYAPVVERLGEVRPEGDGLTFQCHFPDRHKNGDRNWSARAWIGDAGELVIRCLACGANWKEFAAAMNVPVRNFFPNQQQEQHRMATQPQPKAVAVYEYYRADRSLYGFKTRYEPGHFNKPKSFGWHRLCPDDVRAKAGVPDDRFAFVDGAKCMQAGLFVPVIYGDGTWHFRHTENANDPKAVEIPAAGPSSEPGEPLYNLWHPEREGLTITTSPPTTPVILVDGEKDVHTLLDLGFVATCGPHGSLSWNSIDFAKHLVGRSVICIPDNDQPGMYQAMTAAGSFLWSGAASVRIARPGEHGYTPPDHGDVTKWLASISRTDKAKRREAVLNLCKALPRYNLTQPNAQPERKAA